MAGIIPKHKIKGVDFCGTSYYDYIIRSDLGCYMRSGNFNKGSDLSIHALHPCCQHGDHYLANIADKNGQFYIIKGDECRRVTDLTEDTGSSVFTLPPKYRGGDHYLGGLGWFYIIFQEKGIYRRTADLSKDSDSKEFILYPNCRNGLYYWGDPQCVYFLKPTSKWGVEYYKGTRLNTDECTVYSIHRDVLNFLPGGLSITSGPAFGKWVNIKTVSNDSSTPVTWQKKVTKRVGYNKETSSQITHNWKIEGSLSISSGALIKLIAKGQFSFSAEYGGARVNAKKETWNEETEEEEQLSFELKPNERLYLWQYQLGLGSEPVLFCKDLKITDKPDPPPEELQGNTKDLKITDKPDPPPEELQGNTKDLKITDKPDPPPEELQGNTKDLKITDKPDPPPEELQGNTKDLKITDKPDPPPEELQGNTKDLKITDKPDPPPEELQGNTKDLKITDKPDPPPEELQGNTKDLKITDKPDPPPEELQGNTKDLKITDKPDPPPEELQGNTKDLKITDKPDPPPEVPLPPEPKRRLQENTSDFLRNYLFICFLKYLIFHCFDTVHKV